MAIRLAAAACALFAALSGWLLATARSLFDAAWIIGILSIPASSAADLASRAIAGWTGAAQKDVYVDLAMLVLFGLVEYGIAGYIAGWAIDRVSGALKRRVRTPR